MDKLALLIIDVQQAIANEHLYRVDALVSNIKKLLNKARADGIPVFYVQHETENGELEHGSQGWQVVKEIEPLPGEGRSYKRFPDSFFKTDLEKQLSGAGIGRLVIAGLQTEYCMDTSIRRAFSLGFDSTVASDAHSTFDTKILTAEQIIKHHTAVWNGCFAKVMTTDEICQKLL